MSEVEQRDEAAPPLKRRRARRIALGFGAVVLVTLIVLWTQRKPIAEDFIADALEKRGVSARYEVTRIGFRTQRIERLSIGDPRNPDLTADWAEVLIRIGIAGPRVTGVRAHGVRLKGRLVKGAFSFGEVDKLLPAPSGKPFSLPDLDLTISDARARLELPNGPIGVKLDGQGNLTGGFRGKLAAVAPNLLVEGCPLVGATAWLDLSVSDRAPRVAGPVRASALSCPDDGFALTAPQMNVDATLNEALDRWRGSARIEAQRGALGSNVLTGVAGQASFDGGRRATMGKAAVRAASFGIPGASGQGLSIDGDYKLGGTRHGFMVALGGKGAVRRIALDRRMLDSVSFGAPGTPVAPLAAALTQAIRRAGSEASLDADFTVAQLSQQGSLQITRLAAASASGARATLAGDGLRFSWPGSGAIQVDGRMTLDGGGFPRATIDLAQARPGAPITGTAAIAPYAAGGARLALAPVRFTADPRGGSRFDTRITLDGPLGDGRVTGLTLPLAGRIDGQGGFALNPGCVPVGFQSLRITSLALQPTRLSLCPLAPGGLIARRPGRPVTGGARIANPRLAGRLGQSPITLAAADARYALGSGRIEANRLAVRLGPADRQSRLDIGALTGALAGGGIAGRFAGVGGQIANVPLIVSEGAGAWSFRKGVLDLKGGVRVADSATDPRFNPLVSDDFALTLANNRIRAGGLLRTPQGNQPATRVAIAHDLSGGTGNATLDVIDLRFGESLQPDALTRLALGVVANVRGAVNGQGRIRWSPQAVMSDGEFRTDNADLAAAFGPVTGLSGEIRFTDLLGLQTAPGQVLRLTEVNPGLPVKDGVIRYQLLTGNRVQIEGGEWPFAGGKLALDPTLIDLGAQVPRRMTFRLSGADAAAFLQSFEFENINATGTFDGVIPIVFDEDGGRIVDGNLTARPGGGGIAYLGELTKEDLGSWGNVAFQALRDINYRTLDITLNGDLDGEMITQIRFTGLSQGATAQKNFLTRKIAALPIRFNISIRAPFRQLIFSARSFYDPSLLIEQNLPALLDAQKGVQPSESENKP